MIHVSLLFAEGNEKDIRRIFLVPGTFCQQFDWWLVRVTLVVAFGLLP